MMMMRAALLALPLVVGMGVLRLDPNVDQDWNHTFQLGYFYLHPGRYEMLSMTQILSKYCTTLTPSKVNQAMRHLLASWGMTLNVAATFGIRNSSLETLSHDINACSAAGTEIGMTESEKEFVLNAALALWPWNVYAAKNLAWSLEWEGNPHIARTLCRQTSQISGDLGSLLQGAFVSPPLLWTKEEALFSHLKILSEAQWLLTNIPKRESRVPESYINDPSLVIREYQLTWQYTGISPGVVSNAYSRVLNHLFPFLSFEDPFVEKKREIAPHSTRLPIRLGVLAEHEANSSPGLCLMSILPMLSKLTHLDENQLEVRDFHIIYIRRTNSATMFNVKMEELAAETITVDHNPGHHELGRQAIVALRLDILFFIALPTEKFSMLLAQGRLATAQIQFGIGHPITSGSTAVDYSVVSRDMYLSEKSITRSPATNVTECLLWASRCFDELKKNGTTSLSYCSAMKRQGCISGAESPSKGTSVTSVYSEQLVLFESLGFFIDNPLTYYPETLNFDPLAVAFDSPCDALDLKFQEWQLYPNLTARMLGCRDVNGVWKQRTSHMYIAIQNPKKMHPLFDEVLLRIIQHDIHAKILMEHQMPCLIPRWKKTLNLTEEQVYNHFVFVPRLEHRQYLHLVSLASIFLNTFPFGAGITSSEAIGLCIPVLVFAETSSVIHIALAQVRALGDHWIKEFVASSLDEYVEKVMAIVALESAENPLGLRQYRQEICDSRHKLHGPSPLQAAANEWETFLKRI